MAKITTFLAYDNGAEDAVNHYVSIFKDSKVGKKTYYGDGMPLPKGTVMTIDFLLEGQEFVALNGGPEFMFTPAISLVVNCETQEEVDGLWESLSEGGTQGECGWLEDRFGVSWQIVPTVLGELLIDPDPERSQRVMRAMLEMRKLDIAQLERAARAA